MPATADEAQQATSGQQSQSTAGGQEQAVAGSEDGGSPPPSGTSRSSEQAAADDPTGGDAASYRTEGETIYVLDSQLSSSLSEFDEKMRKEMEALSNARRSTSVGNPSLDTAEGSGGTTSGGGTTADDGADGQSESASGSTQGEGQKGSQQASRAESSTASQSGDSTGEASNTTSYGRRGGAPRPGIPDGSDDDIVARQLREAAEAETDPVLKEKLWKEYINYKKGSS